MKRDQYRLFSEGNLGHLTLKNRLIRAATYEGAMTEDGRLTPAMLDLYRNLAAGGVGAVITGHMAVMRQGKGHNRQTCIWDDGYIDEIAQIADVVHASGNDCKIIAQLNHAGRQIFRDNTLAECVGPSAVPSPIFEKRARALEPDEIPEIVDAFAEALVRVKKAGFDGAEIHAAHGYLLSSFLSPYTNRRTDRYGGSTDNRVALLREIVGRARDRVGDFTILVKLNSNDHVEGGIDLESFREIVHKVAEMRVDAIEISGSMWDCLSRPESELGFFPLPIPEARTRIDRPDKQSYYVQAADGLHLDIPVIVVGGHRNVDSMEVIMNRGTIDFLSMARPLICEPDLPSRWLNGRGSANADCVSCNSCLLEVRTRPLKCVLKQSRLKQTVLKKVTPHVWRLIVK